MIVLNNNKYFDKSCANRGNNAHIYANNISMCVGVLYTSTESRNWTLLLWQM